MSGKTNSKLYWPTALVLVAILVANLLVVLLLQGEERVMSLAAVDALGLTILAFMRQVWGFTAVLVLVLAGSATGCTAADQQRVHGAFIDTMTILKWGCRAVGVVDTVLPTNQPTSGGDSGDEEPHTIDGEDP